MFNNCPNLVNAPELPATDLANYCYELMFTHCTSLTKAPSILPAEKAKEAVYNAMFARCTSLEKAPLINLNTNLEYTWSMYNLFTECKNLNYIKVGFTNWNSRKRNCWLGRKCITYRNICMSVSISITRT